VSILARVLVTATLCVVTVCALAQEPTRIATVISADGIVSAIDVRGERRELTRRSPVFQGDTIETGEQGDIQLRFVDGSLLALTTDGKLRITEYREEGESDANIVLELFSGCMRSLSALIDSAHYRLSVPGGFLRLTAGKAEIASRVQITNAAIVKAVLSVAPVSALDLGCGEGWLTRTLTAAGIDTMGIDAVPELIAHASSQGGGRYAVLAYQDLDTAALGRRFDCVICNFSLIGDGSTRQLFAAVPALLNPGGHFIVQTLHSTTQPDSERKSDGWRKGSWQGFSPAFRNPPPWYYRTQASWIDLFETYGFARPHIEEPALPASGQPASQLFIARLA
jgi:SAM-dependent methyltransferase